MEVGLVDTLDGIRHETLRVAAALGEEERGQALVAAMDARLAKARAGRARGPATDRRRLYGERCRDRPRHPGRRIARRSRASTTSPARLGFDGYGYLPLETLVVAHPDLLVMDRERPRRASLASTRLRHPVLRELFSGHHVVALPERLWTCPGTFTAEAVDILAAARVAMTAEPRQ